MLEVEPISHCGQNILRNKDLIQYLRNQVKQSYRYY